ncbi:aldo/keto reductase [Psychromarinibacter halotolerans]|uniref:Aldo/keto reductase n=1 Tax=Psychromarinibacter halotolerans TaxID=1775175 RepID=A0ABV7GV55_9RHOB|nr:aldo/keto reductase [Psychromarinibacter halotolerans]MDF0595283.1 aldo/keto reductase [Psychromarinibacter halotolerans]
MKTRRLGNTALNLTELSFGAAPIGNLYQPVDRAQVMQVLDTAWDAGIRYFDTAPYYGQGLSERRLGDYLQGKPRGDFVLSTKVGRLLSPVTDGPLPDNGFVDALPFNVRYDYSYDGIMRSWEDSLQRLGLPSVDILFVHDLEPDTFTGDDYAAHLETFAKSGIKALEQLKSEGSIGAYGLGVNQAEACVNVMERVGLDCLLMAGRYSLLDRSACTRLMGMCEDSGTAMVVGGVFNSGILATGAVPGATFNYTEASDEVMERVRGMQAVAEAHGVTLANAALQFPLKNPVVASVLIGSSKPSSLTRNFDTFADPLPDALWPEMDALAIHG